MQDFIFYSEKFDLKQLAEKEKQLGNAEVVLCRNFSEKELNELKKELEEKKFSVKFFTCHLLLKANSKELNVFKNRTDFVGVLGGNVFLNNFAVSNKKIDFLFKPCVEGRLSFDTATARIAKENKTQILIPFSQFLKKDYLNISLLRNYSFSLKLMKKFKLNARVISFASNISELRSLKDLESFKGFLEKKYEKVVE